MIKAEKYSYEMDLEGHYNQPAADYADYDYAGYNEKKAPKNKSKVKKIRNLYMKAGAALFIYGIILVYLTCQSSSLGYQIISLEKDIDQLYVDNAHLSYDIAQMSSLAYIEDKARTELGMKNPDMNTAMIIPVSIIEKKNIADGDSNYPEERDNTLMKPLEKFYSALLLLSDKSQ